MELKEKERTLIQDLQTQEQSCVEKYGKYAAQAKDPELKSLFETIQKEEQKHYDTLQQVLDGSVPACDCNDTQGKDYEPKVTYGTLDNSEDKTYIKNRGSPGKRDRLGFFVSVPAPPRGRGRALVDGAVRREGS